MKKLLSSPLIFLFLMMLVACNQDDFSANITLPEEVEEEKKMEVVLGHNF